MGQAKHLILLVGIEEIIHQVNQKVNRRFDRYHKTGYSVIKSNLFYFLQKKWFQVVQSLFGTLKGPNGL